MLNKTQNILLFPQEYWDDTEIVLRLYLYYYIYICEHERGLCVKVSKIEKNVKRGKWNVKS